MARILVADDEADLRELLRTVLSFDEHEVAVAEDGEAVLGQLAAAPVDLLLLDVMMPRRDGWWVLEQVKTSLVWCDIPVVMLTARAADLDRLQGAIGGAVRYVTKPFSVAELRRIITDVLEGPPEPEQRQRSQRQALVELARLETGGAGGEAGASAPTVAARPRLTRLDGPGRGEVAPRAKPRSRVVDGGALSDRQREVLAAVVAAHSISVAASALEVSRSYLYASLGRIAEKCGATSGPELVRKLRAGELTIG
jgi:CheY-like chemotaxis protein